MSRLPALPVVIESTRLLIRSPRTGDGALVYPSVLASLGALREYPASLPWAMEEPSIETVERFCRDSAERHLAGTAMAMLVFVKSSNTHVGNIGLHDFDWNVPKAEIGFWGHSAYRGRGFLLEAATTLTDFAFNDLKLRRIEALPEERNVRSCRLCECAGYTLEGTLRNYRAWSDNVVRDIRVYAMVR